MKNRLKKFLQADVTQETTLLAGKLKHPDTRDVLEAMMESADYFTFRIVNASQQIHVESRFIAVFINVNLHKRTLAFSYKDKRNLDYDTKILRLILAVRDLGECSSKIEESSEGLVEA